MVDLRRLAEAERESQARRQAVEETGRPFDLSRDLMLRARLLRPVSSQTKMRSTSDA